MDQEYPNEMPGDTGDTGDTDDTDPNFPQASVLACKPTCPSAVPPADCKTFSGETGESTNLVVTSCLTFNSNNNQPYVFKYVNVLNNGIIWFVDDGNTVDFRANSILVEQGGRIVGGQWCKPFGCNGGKLKIGLWGTDPSEQDTVSADGQGITCLTEGGCYPAELTTSPHCCQNSPLTNPCSSTTDCEICNSGPSCTSFNQNAIFEGYGSLPHDSANNPFGFKVLAVSYGGSLELFGRKGVRPSDFVDPSKKSPAMCRTPSDSFNSSNWSVFSGYSWTRLGKTANVGDTTISLDRSVNWEKGDQIVVSTTDWHASHSELLTLNSAVNSKTYTASIASSFKFAHDGNYFVIDPVLSAQSKNPNKDINMKAAVGLLSRSITIYSLGADSKTNFPAASACTINSNNSPDCYFGGHTIVRQGFAKFQLQGVELKQLGQGGRMAHYPIHYHLCKRTYYTNTFVKDCSSWDSMNRFYTIHATQGVTLERNVGYLSVGHGYYLEDGSEVNNKLCYNLAVGIRAPLVTYLEAQAKLDSSSPTARKVPGILPYVNTKPQDKVLTTDILGGDDAMPVAFWTMGMWNDFVGNMAAGVSGYGSCFWLLGSSLSGRSRSLKWTKYSRTEEDYTQWGSVAGRVTPLKRFRDNSCSTAYAALQTAITVFPGTLDMTGFSKVPNTRDGVVPHPYKLPYDALPIVTQNYNPTKFSTSNAYLTSTTLCGRAVPFGGNALDTNVEVCSGPIIDRFRASFNWPEVNFGSVWLRGYWFALLNSFVTDQLFGGVGLVTGGNWQDM